MGREGKRSKGKSAVFAKEGSQKIKTAFSFKWLEAFLAFLVAQQ